MGRFDRGSEPKESLWKPKKITMAFAILRIKKHSGTDAARSLSGMTKHNIERDKVPNADIEKSSQNMEIIGTGDYRHDVEKRIEESKALVQKNNVKAIEHLMTASPEFFEGKTRSDLRPFARRCYNFLKETYGEENIVSMSLHMDEKTPHIHAFVVPVVNGKLKSGKEIKRISAKKYVNGKKAMQDLQDNFAEHFKDLDLERGRKRSKAKHITIQEYYALINSTAEISRKMEIDTPRIQSRPPRIGSIDNWMENENRRIAEDLKESLQQAETMMRKKNALTTAEALKLKANDEKALQINHLKNEIDRLEKEKADKAIGARKYKERAEKNAKQAALAQKYLKDVLSGQITVEKLNDLKKQLKINKGMGR